MPQSLDENGKKIVLTVCTFTTIVIGMATVGAVKVIRRGSDKSVGWSLFGGILASVALMATVTALLTAPIVVLFDHVQEQKVNSSSSINFCEQDFEHIPFIAEPANMFSSLCSYIPLGLMGLVGPAATQQSQVFSTRRFSIIYFAIVTIGFGSTALHALLTAETQAGDELPMLWYCAAAAFCAIDIILHHQKANPRETSSAHDSWLGHAVALSVAIATATYLGGRNDFTIFYLLFSFSALVVICSVIYIGFALDFGETRFRADVLLPLAVSAGLVLVVAKWIWVAEMMYCDNVLLDGMLGTSLAPFVWNRVVHPVWHMLSGILAFLIVQILVAAHGMQQGLGVPTVCWDFAPYVVFSLRPPSFPYPPPSPGNPLQKKTRAN